MLCAKCKAQVHDNAAFCPTCGTSLGASPLTSQQQVQASVKLPTSVLLMGLIFGSINSLQLFYVGLLTVISFLPSRPDPRDTAILLNSFYTVMEFMGFMCLPIYFLLFQILRSRRSWAYQGLIVIFAVSAIFYVFSFSQMTALVNGLAPRAVRAAPFFKFIVGAVALYCGVALVFLKLNYKTFMAVAGTKSAARTKPPMETI